MCYTASDVTQFPDSMSFGHMDNHTQSHTRIHTHSHIHKNTCAETHTRTHVHTYTRTHVDDVKGKKQKWNNKVCGRWVQFHLKSLSAAIRLSGW